MRISDKERHERAKNFRDMVSAREYGIPGKVGSFVDIDDLLSELLDRRVYDSEVAIDACEALDLADLIDRPTCTIVESYMGDNLEFVEETPYHVLSCGHIAYGDDDPMFCPVCGAAVTDDYR